MVWLTNQQIGCWKRKRILVGTFLCWVLVMFITPKVPLNSFRHHVFADKRNFMGVPNTLNVMTNFPFLIIGVLGFVLCIGGSFFNISLKGEIWGWTLFYASIASLAFGSAYYHLRPDDNRIIWDTLPFFGRESRRDSGTMLPRLASIHIIIQRCLRQMIPCLAIPIMAVLLPPKYTHSRFWLWATAAYTVAKIEGLADNKIYKTNRYIISGHSLGHLCSAVATLLLTIMLLYRSVRFNRLGDLKGHP